MGARPSGARLGAEEQQQTQDQDILLEVVNNSGLKLHRSHVDPPRVAAALPEVLTSRHRLLLEDVQQEVFINYTSCEPSHLHLQEGRRRADHSMVGQGGSVPPKILSIYVAIAEGGLRALIGGGACRLEIAATFSRLPEHADELRKLASRQGRLGVCSWEPRLAPRSALVCVAEPERSILQQRTALLDALQASASATAPVSPNRRGGGGHSEDVPVQEGVQDADAGRPLAEGRAGASTELCQHSHLHGHCPEQGTRPAGNQQTCPAVHGDLCIAEAQESIASQQHTVTASTAGQMALLAPEVPADPSISQGTSTASNARVPPPALPESAKASEYDNARLTSAETNVHACPEMGEKDVVTGRSRTGALALEVQKALKEKREREAIERKRQEEEELMKANCSAVIASQDIEYQRSLLHDQVRDLQKETAVLRDSERSLLEALTASSQRRQNAETRISRYGENPRIRAEADDAADEEKSLQSELMEVSQRLQDLKEALEEKEHLLCLAALADDPDEGTGL
ncbi:unnamed protein product [Symbiodinium pilosum]|uniref:Uncharacterized protein n=1 Tax=Symbiodinium pilosum TaxID=2952 RepID=A0A812KRP1_SYMPI|nr:unnamed protein product [Symbiodinium pilosum]